MPIRFANNVNPSNIYFCEQSHSKVYFGNELYWSKTPPVTPFTLTHTKQTSFKIQIYCSQYNTVTINWGDGQTTVVNSNNFKLHTYASAGTYNVTLTGNLSNVTQLFCQNQQVTNIELGEGLVNLIILRIDNNSFTYLNIPAQYTKLYQIYVYTNNSLTSLNINQKLQQNYSWDIQAYSTKITTFNIPSTGSNIANNINLNNCTSLISVNLGCITTIYSFNIKNCSSFTTFSSILISCAYFYADGCTSLINIDLSTLVTLTGNLELQNNYKLQTVNIQNVIGSLNSTLRFNGCPLLQTINLTSLQYANLINCQNDTSLTSVTLTSLIKMNGELNFYGCSSLTSITLPLLIQTKYIDCYNCTSLQTISANELLYFNGVRELGTRFTNCNNLTYISFSKLINSQPYLMFDSTSLNYLNIDNLAECTNLYITYTKLTSISLPNLTTSSNINLNNNSLITSILLPNLTTCAGAFVFSNCPNLTTLTIPSNIAGITNLQGNATKITSLNISAGNNPLTIVQLQSCAELITVTLPSTVGALSTCYIYDCPKLTNITMPTTVTGNVTNAQYRLHNNPKLISLTLPNVTIFLNLWAYSNTLMTSFIMNNSTTRVNNLYVHSNSALTTLILSSALSTMENVQLHLNTSLTSITIPNSVTGVTTQLKCDFNTSMTTLNLPTNINILPILYINNTALTTFSVPANITTMSILNAYGCNNLTTFSTSNVTNVGTLNLSSCLNLTTLNIVNLVGCTSVDVRYANALTPPQLTQLTQIGILSFNRCGFTSEQVDNILTQCLTVSNSDTNCNLNLNNTGTIGNLNSTPSAQGLLDKDTLISRGWSVTTA